MLNFISLYVCMADVNKHNCIHMVYIIYKYFFFWNVGENFIRVFLLLSIADLVQNIHRKFNINTIFMLNLQSKSNFINYPKNIACNFSPPLKGSRSESHNAFWCHIPLVSLICSHCLMPSTVVYKDKANSVSFSSDASWLDLGSSSSKLVQGCTARHTFPPLLLKTGSTHAYYIYMFVKHFC